MREVKLSTARNVMVMMVDSTDHITGKTGLTLTITASKAGAAFSSITPTVTERGSGWYSLALLSTHLDTLGDLALHITAASADPSDLLICVVAYDPSDSASLGLSRIDATVSSRSTLTQAQILSDSTPFQGARIDATISSRSTFSGGAVASVSGDVGGKVLGGGASPITGVGARAVDSSGNAIAPASQLTTHDTDVKARLPASLVSGRIDASVGAMAAGTVTATAIAAGAIGASQAPNLDAAVSTRAVENGGRLATLDGKVIGTLATGTHSPQSGDAYSRIGATGSGLTSLAQASALSTVGSNVTDVKAKTDALPASPAAVGSPMTLSLNAITDSVLDPSASTEIAGVVLDTPVEGGVTLRQAMRVLLSVLAGKASGAPSGPIAYRDILDVKDRVVGTIDSNGNRTSVTLNVV